MNVIEVDNKLISLLGTDVVRIYLAKIDFDSKWLMLFDIDDLLPEQAILINICK